MIEARIAGRTYKHFSSVDISLSLDTIASTFTIVGLFDILDENLKTIFTPLAYHKIELWAVDEELDINEKMLTGTILNTPLGVQKKIKLTSISGYSLPGVFEDVNIPVNLYPLQFDGMGLDQIAKKLCDEFSLQLDIYDNAKKEAAKPFELAKAQPTETIKDFLSNIARSRGLTLAHDNFGKVVLYKVLAKIPPKFKIDESDFGVDSINLKVAGQPVHSDVTVINQGDATDENSGQSTVVSPFVPKGVKRPKVVMLRYGKNIDTKENATAIVCAEAKSFPIVIELAGWTYNNKFVRAGFYIEVTAPSIFISTTKLVLENVSFKSDPKKGKTMTLTGVLPCIYTGVLPSKSPFK